jgi:2-methylcitrate dehydratase PrpD
VDEPKGDPGNTLSRNEREDKARRLAAFAGGASADEIERLIAWAWTLADQKTIGRLL